jgi:ABC-type Mn2+/Zn2+ transport system permease subunit
VWSATIGGLSVVGGLTASRGWDLAPGGTIVLCAAGFFLVANLARGLRGAQRPAEHIHQH